MKTLKQSLLLVAIAFCIVQIPHQTFASDPGSPEVFLWETHIKACTLFIAGTVHIGRDDQYPPDDVYLRYLERSDEVILEVADDFETMANKMLSYIQKDRLPEEKYFRYTLDSAALDGIIEVLGTDKFHKYDQYNAWVLITQLSVNKMRLLGYDPQLAVDRYIRDQAVARNKEIIGLENAEDQFKLFEFDLPYDTQLKILKHNIGNIRAAAEKEGALCDAYFNNQVEKFSEIFTERFDFENPGEKAAYDKVFAERNKTWANSLEAYASKQRGNVFVAMGAGHLFGPGNLLECLRDKGFAVNHLGR